MRGITIMNKTAPKTKPLTIKERKLVEQKAQGKDHITAHDNAGYSKNMKPATKQVEVSRTLKKPHVKNALQIALQKHDITLDNALAPISKGLRAIKQNEFTGEITDDIALQLKASDRALKLLGVQNTEGTGQFHLHLHNARQKYDL